MRHSEQILSKGDLKLDIANEKAYLVENGQETDIRLTPVEFKLLSHFILNEERVLSDEQLLSAFSRETCPIGDRPSLHEQISSLCKKLSYRAHYIEKISRVGFRFTLSECQGKRTG
jgi:DNA-binding response OmpR family regulator